MDKDLDRAKEALKSAINLEPNNKQIRQEYMRFMEKKSKKEKEW